VSIDRLPPPFSPADRDAVLALADQVATETGSSPLSDQTRIALRRDDPGTSLLLVREGDEPVAVAVVGDGGATVEIVLPPGGDAALEPLLAALREDSSGALLLWAHGQDAPLSRALVGSGLPVTRELLQLRRRFGGDAQPVPEPRIPEGVTITTFEPGRDEDDWLALNALAFTHHPEQGRMTATDLADREAEPWFDPAGFFLAHREDRLVGFHWTKVHRDSDEPIGEVYVVGVHPDEQGRGLGSALTAIGLRHLADAGLRTAMLYVEADNAPAVAVYERLGFTAYDRDVCYRL
jgi:mycothiol synthase